MGCLIERQSNDVFRSLQSTSSFYIEILSIRRRRSAGYRRQIRLRHGLDLFILALRDTVEDHLLDRNNRAETTVLTLTAKHHCTVLDMSGVSIVLCFVRPGSIELEHVSHI